MSRTTLALALSCALLSPAAMARGYSFTTQPINYVDLGPGATIVWDGAVAPADDEFADVPIGFGFDFQGSVWTTVRISTNGYLTFGSGQGALAGNVALPDPALTDGMICPYWDDLLVALLGIPASVSYETVGAPGARTMTVQWRSMHRYGESAANYSILDFQVLLYETTGEIEFRYDVTALIGAPADSSATLGLGHPGGTTATVPVLGAPALGIAQLPQRLSIQFTPALPGQFAMTKLEEPFSALGAGRTTLFLGSSGPYDDNYADIPIGFPFDFFGTPRSTMRISTNGYATFPPEPGGTYTNQRIPDVQPPNDLITPWWDDLNITDLGAIGEVSYETSGVLIGARQTIVEWRNVSTVGETAADHTSLSFQIHLHEAGNIVEFRYGPKTTVGSPLALSASIGIEDGTGVTGFAPDGAYDLHSFYTFPASGSVVWFGPVTNLLCGDCNADLSVGVTDALLAAQHGVALITLSGADFSACNVHGIAGSIGLVDILDALDIAQHAVGVLPSLSCAP